MNLINQDKIKETIKLLLLKEAPLLLKEIDFNHKDAFLEPLLFTFFNYKTEEKWSSELLTEFMQGYFLKNQNLQINSSHYLNNIAYLPYLGYFTEDNPELFEQIHIIENTSIEILKYPIYFHNNIFRNKQNQIINRKEIIVTNSLFQKNISYLTNAINLIKENSPKYFGLINQCCKKIVLFKTNPANTNSFATIKAHGIAFINVYQDDYDEVFFVDDIAHQAGHIILTTLFFDKKKIFKINEEHKVEEITNQKDHRTINTLLHALYTYYTTILCLDNCLKNKVFNNKQKKESIARIGFYLNKCNIDLERFEQINVFFKGIENVLNSDGIKFYLFIKENLLIFSENWLPTISTFNYSNQPYNFTFEHFNKLNH
ncbi:hypothetical protein CFS9_17910 [Flavobacterium sp. CFS9]|uniref:HEXXH motif-containing protein n=1 Tax=Flavobacterium sp. CFS9 TaxID=3143118 RepID=A0AAT9H103_9FLAO